MPFYSQTIGFEWVDITLIQHVGQAWPIRACHSLEAVVNDLEMEQVTQSHLPRLNLAIFLGNIGMNCISSTRIEAWNYWQSCGEDYLK